MTIAKVVVLGRGEAGKSTLIKALSGAAMNLEVRGRTVAMDHATLSRGARSISLVGVPGQVRFAPVREVLIEGASAAVWVHPAGERPDPGTVSLVRTLALHHVPYLVFVNQRAGSPTRDGFSAPPQVAAPHAIVHGNLSAPNGSVAELEALIWELAGHRR